VLRLREPDEDRAVSLYREALASRERLQGRRHDSARYCRGGLCNALYAQAQRRYEAGRYSDAEKCSQESYELAASDLAPGNLTLKDKRYQLLFIRQVVGADGDKLKAFEEGVRLERQTRNMNDAQWKEEIRLLERAVELQNQALGMNPHTSALMLQLRDLKEGSAQEAGAVEIYEQSPGFTKRRTGARSSTYLDAVRDAQQTMKTLYPGLHGRRRLGGGDQVAGTPYSPRRRNVRRAVVAGEGIPGRPARGADRRDVYAGAEAEAGELRRLREQSAAIGRRTPRGAPGREPFGKLGIIGTGAVRGNDRLRICAGGRGGRLSAAGDETRCRSARDRGHGSMVADPGSRSPHYMRRACRFCIGGANAARQKGDLETERQACREVLLLHDHNVSTALSARAEDRARLHYVDQLLEPRNRSVRS